MVRGPSAPEECKGRWRAIAIAVGLATAVVAASAGAAGFSQPERVWVTTTGNHSERVSTLDVSTDPGGPRTVVMSLGPDTLKGLRLGDRLKASSELEVTTDCLIASPRCVGNPYNYDPTIATYAEHPLNAITSLRTGC